MKIRALCFAFLAASAGVCNAVVPPQVVWSTFGPNETYDVGATPIQHFSSGFFLDQAVKFTPQGNDYWLAAVRAPLYQQSSGSYTVTLHIATDGGGVPGAELASRFYSGGFPVDTPAVDDKLPPTEISWPSQQVYLHAGTPYWLYITATPNTPGDVDWMLNNIGAAGNYADRSTGNPNPIPWYPGVGFPTPAFSILGTAVPEPGTMLLVLVACGMPALRRQRQ
jgi:hypothetical protein